MKSILVSGGSSGIGLHAARDFLASGHRVVLLGRDAKKGEEALTSFGDARDRASFFSVDLSTHDGVRDAAKRVLAENDALDAVLHSTGVFTNKDVRTADGLPLFFAVNYLSRYHLTQLLLPALRRAKLARVVMMTARVPVSTALDVRDFAKYEPFRFLRARLPIQVANHHYAAHIAKTEPGLLAGGRKRRLREDRHPAHDAVAYAGGGGRSRSVLSRSGSAGPTETVWVRRR